MTLAVVSDFLRNGFSSRTRRMTRLAMQPTTAERTDAMSNPAAKHTDEFRRETNDYAISTERPVIKYCRELSSNSKTANKRAQNRRCEPACGPDQKAERCELRKAKRSIHELEMENAEYPVKLTMCLLGVSRSGFSLAFPTAARKTTGRPSARPCAGSCLNPISGPTPCSRSASCPTGSPALPCTGV